MRNLSKRFLPGHQQIICPGPQRQGGCSEPEKTLRVRAGDPQDGATRAPGQIRLSVSRKHCWKSPEEQIVEKYILIPPAGHLDKPPGPQPRFGVLAHRSQGNLDLEPGSTPWLL